MIFCKCFRKFLSVTVAFLLLISTVIPVMASDSSDSKVTSDTGYADQSGSSITFPVTLNENKPTRAEVTVQNPNQSSKLMSSSVPSLIGSSSDSGPAQKVETVMTNVEGATPGIVTLITADRYYLYKDRTNTQKLQFMMQFTDLQSVIGEGSYTVKLTKSETDTSVTLSESIYNYPTCDVIYFSDISQLIVDPSITNNIYVSIWKDNVKMYGSNISVKYVEDCASIAYENRYIRTDKMDFYPCVKIPASYSSQLTDANGLTASMIDGSGQTVGISLRALTIQANYPDSNDERYDFVFSHPYHFHRNCIDVSTNLYRTGSWAEGVYSIQLEKNGVPITAAVDGVQAVNGYIVRNMYTQSRDGFPQPVSGGSDLYATLSVEGASLDNFDVYVEDSGGNIIGTVTEQRYSGTNLVYHLKLQDDLTFSNTGIYSVKFVCRDTSAGLFYSGIPEESIYPESDFNVYDVIYNERDNKALFTMKTINSNTVQSGIVTFKLFNGEYPDFTTAVPLAVVDAAVSDTMTVHFFDSQSNTLAVDTGTYTIAAYVDGVQRTWYQSVYLRSDSSDFKTTNWEKPYFMETENGYHINLDLSKDYFGLTPASAYEITLEDSHANVLTRLRDNITVNDIEVLTEISGQTVTRAAVNLSGTLPVTPGVISEGYYNLNVKITNNTTDNDIAVSKISVLKSDKVYAINSNNDFDVSSATEVKGYIDLLKTRQYDLSRFSLDVKDLNGNSISVGTPVMDKGTGNWAYDDYMKYSAQLSAEVPSAYYFVKLKYDGKDIYDLRNPIQLINAGYKEIFRPLVLAPTGGAWCPNSNDAIYGVKIDGRTGQSDIKVLLYSYDNKLLFTPVATIAPVKNDSGIFAFPEGSLTGIDPAKFYDGVLLIDGKPAGSTSRHQFGMKTEQTVAVTGVTLDQTSMDIKVGEQKTLTATVSPANASVKTVKWSSSNTSIATVDASGFVTGVAPGNAIITATTESGSKKAQCSVNVAANQATLNITKLAYGGDPNTAITAVNNVYNIEGAKYPLATSIPLKVTLQGTDYTSTKNYSYSITMNGSVSIKTGTVSGSALLAGFTDEIPRQSGQVDGNYSYNVVIKDGTTQVAAVAFTLSIAGNPVPVTGVTSNRILMKMDAGDSTILSAIITPSNATNKKVTWSSSKTNVATVNADTGLVTAVGAGSTVITVITEDGSKTATCTVNVCVSVSGTLTYGSNPASGAWVSLWKKESGSETYIGKNTDAEGKFTFPKLMTGEYRIQAYSSNARYEGFEQSFTISEGDVSVAPVTGFRNKYENTSVLTVTVAKQGGGTLDSPFYLYIYNYEKGVSEWKSYDGSSTTVTISDLPYVNGGSIYSIYLSTSEQTDYYYKYDTITVDNATEAYSFNVPVTYKIKGTVLDKSNVPVQSIGVKASGNSGTHWTLTDANGNFIVMGLYNGSYELSVDDYRYASTTSVSVQINNLSVTTGVSLVVQKGMTLVGKVLKGTVPAYKAYIYLRDNDGNYLASGYAAGSGGYVLDGAIKKAGVYQLSIVSIYDRSFVYQDFVSEPVTITVTEENMAAGRMMIDLAYSDPTTGSQIFTGAGNLVLATKGIVHTGSDLTLVVKYKNNGNMTVDADFTLGLPAGITGESTFQIDALGAGKSGDYRIPLSVGTVTGNYLKIPVKVTVNGKEYDFGSINLEIAGITINGPGAVKSTDSFVIYGEATAGSIIKIRNLTTGEVLGSATPNGRWYSAELRPMPEGKHTLVAEAVNGDITTLSKTLSIESKADQITIGKVMSGSAGSVALPFNSLIGVCAFTVWVDSYLNGRDINLGVLFENGSSINRVTYHFSDLDFAATKDSNGYWLADIKGWSGAGLKTITATVDTTDNRTLTYIIAEVTVLIDPSGTITDVETGDPLAGVTVLCEVKKGDVWEAWDSKVAGTADNPQITGSDGKYGWMVPNGLYRVCVAKDGYLGQTSPEMTVPPERKDVNFALTPSALVASISLNKASLTLTAGGSETLTATVTPDDATNANNIKWTSSNTSVATVNNGVVKAISAGSAIITAKAGGCSTNCAITINASSHAGGNETVPSGGGGVLPTPPAAPTTSSAVTASAIKADGSMTLEADSTGKATIKANQLGKVEKLTISGVAVLVFNKAAIAALGALSGDVTVSMSKVDLSGLSTETKAAVGDRPVYEFSAMAGGKAITDFGGGAVSICIPYTPKAGEDINAIVIYYIDGNGQLNMVRGCACDPATKTVNFKVSHFSKYAVGYNKKSFSDMPSWAKEYITYLSAREIFGGVGSGKYGSSDNITRADFVTALARISGADLTKASTSKFTDVDDKAYYANAVAWAVNNGITKGTGDGRFSPKANITRQDMAVMIRNFEKALNFKLLSTVAETKFADQSAISSYAVAACSELQRAGIINGKVLAGRSGMYFAPKEYASRAETAKILALVLKSISK